LKSHFKKVPLKDNKKLQNMTSMSAPLTCPCNNNSHTYPSRFALSQHKKSKSHIAWVNGEELRELKITLTQTANENIKKDHENKNKDDESKKKDDESKNEIIKHLNEILMLRKQKDDEILMLRKQKDNEILMLRKQKDDEILMLRTQLDGFHKLANKSMDGLESHALPNDTFKRFSQIPK